MDIEILHTYIDIFRDYVYKGDIGDTLVLRRMGEKGKYIPTVNTKYCDESYKEDVFAEARKSIDSISSTSTDADVIAAVKAALKECKNLIRWESINPIVDLFEKNEHGYADIFKQLYCCETDEINDRNCFETLCNREYIGKKYQILAYLFFIKDKDSYLPASPKNFDSLFPLIGIKSNMVYHCSWGNYTGFIQNIRDVQKAIEERLHCDVSLLTAHSIVWILGTLKQIPLEIEQTENADEPFKPPVNKNSINLNNTKYNGSPRKRSESKERTVNIGSQRDRTISEAALMRANYQCECEINQTHPTFARQSDDNHYMEAHHLIPWAYQDLFKDYSLDNVGNIVCLCSNCHNQLHHGKKDDVKRMVKHLYKKKCEELEKANLFISEERLLLMY